MLTFQKSLASISEQATQKKGLDEVSSPDLTFATTSLKMGVPKSFQNCKHLVFIHLSKTHWASQRKEVIATPGPKGQLSNAKSPPFQFL